MPMLILDKPKSFDGVTIELPRYHRAHLSLFRESWVSVVILPGRDQSHQRAELILSPISEDSWDDLWRITATMHDRKGLVNDMLELLASRQLNILAAESSSMERDSIHTIEVICDAHRYQTPHYDGTAHLRRDRRVSELRDLRRYIIAKMLPDLVVNSSGEPTVQASRMRALFNARLALDQCEIDFQAQKAHFKPMRERLKIERRKETGELFVRLPGKILDVLLPMLGGDVTKCTYLLVSDTKERFLRGHFTSSPRQILAPTIRHSERTGAVAAITRALRTGGFNILTMLTRLDDQNRTAEAEFVISGNETDNLESRLESCLGTPELVGAFNVQIDYPRDYDKRPSFKPITVASSAQSSGPADSLSVLEQLKEHVDRYELSLARPGSSPDDEERLRLATAYHSEEARCLKAKDIPWLFLSCAYRGQYVKETTKIAAEYGYRILTGEELDSETKRDGVISKIRAATHFLGIWTWEKGFPLEERTSEESRLHCPSPWMIWELGVAQAYGLPVRLAISKEVHTESWSRINGDPVHFMFDGSNFLQVVRRALESLKKASSARREI
jgi:predicted amino acid-binding ACT domain protein